MYVLTFGVYSCKKNEETEEYTGSDYINNQTGYFIIYDVDSIVLNDFTGTRDTFYFQIKEKLESYFTDETGKPALRIERYYRQNPQDNWQIKDVWSSSTSLSAYEKSEENIRFTKLVFPLRSKSRWNGNRMNSLGEQIYEMKEPHVSYKIGSIVFDSTVTVVQANDSSLVNQKSVYEVYARGKGLIYKYFYDITDKDSVLNLSLPLAERANSGVVYSYKYISDGKE